MPKNGTAVLAGILGGLHHAARAARAESAGDEDAVRVVEQRRAAFLLERLGLDPVQPHLEPVREPAVEHRLVEALVRVLVAGVLADDVNRQLVGRVLDAVHQLLPRLGAGFGQRQAEQLEDDPVEPFGREHERHFVDRRRRPWR